MRIVRQRRGQFIIIAALLVAIMMVSVSTIMYSAVTYYRYERWDEYLSIIDNVKIGSQRVVEISLANYTTWNNYNNVTILRNNLQRWVNDTRKAYAGFGINLSFTEDELDHDWNEEESSAAADATFTLDITSAGLTGYQFTTPVLLKVKIIEDEEEPHERYTRWNASDKGKELTISLIVYKEDSIPKKEDSVTNLKKDNFRVSVNGTWLAPENFTVARYSDATYESLIYDIYCSPDTPPDPKTFLVSVAVIDTRGIKVVADVTVTVST